MNNILSGSIPVLIGVIVGAIIGGIITYITQIEINDHIKKDRGKQLANTFLKEVKELNRFIKNLDDEDINSKTIRKPEDSSYIPHVISIDSQQNDNPLLNIQKLVAFDKIIQNQLFFNLLYEVPIKKTFELFNKEIYSFDNYELIQDLNKLGTMVYIAEDMIHKYHKDQQNGKTPNNLDMVHFLSMIENIKPTVNKILSEGYLEKIASEGNF